MRLQARGGAVVGGDGRVIRGRYRIDRQIGGGPRSSTFLVTDLKTARPCILKALRQEQALPGEVQRFETQAGVLARLDHPVIPAFVEYFVEGEGAAREQVLVVRYHPGESLERLVAKERPLTETQAIALLRRLVPVLVYLHDLTPPLVHRSIKASNIIVGPDGRPCLTDFDFAVEGSAGEDSPGSPSDGAEPGSYAPEVALGGPVPASDIYSIGVATIFAMCGEDPATLPRDGGRMRVRDAVRASEGFLAVLQRMIEPSLERRYPDARSLEADLARLGAGSPPARAPALPVPASAAALPAAPVPPVGPRESERPRRRAALPLLAVLAVTLVVAGLAWFGEPRRAAPPGDSLIAPAPSVGPPAALPPASPEAQPTPSETQPPPPGDQQPVPAAAPAATAPDPEAAAPAAGPPAPAAPGQAAAPPPAGEAATPSPPAAEALPVEGRLEYAGEPVTRLTSARPVFWFRNQETGMAVKPRLEYDDGAFKVHGLPDGRYGMSARIDLEPGNPNLFPGDLDGFAAFSVAQGRAPALRLALRRVMHLVQPVDNGRAIGGWEVPCGAGNVHPGRVVFSWEPLGEGATYEVTVERMACSRGGVSAGRAFKSSGTESWTRLELPPSKEGEFYSFRLAARKEGRPVGIMTTHGEKGVGWDYRFVVK